MCPEQDEVLVAYYENARKSAEEIKSLRQFINELHEKLEAKTEQWRGLIRALNGCAILFQAIADQPADQDDARIGACGLQTVEKAKMEFCQ